VQNLNGLYFVAAVCELLPYRICDWSVLLCDSEYIEILEHNAAEHKRKFGPNKLKIWKRMSKNRDQSGYETDDEGAKEGEGRKMKTTATTTARKQRN